MTETIPIPENIKNGIPVLQDINPDNPDDLPVIDAKKDFTREQDEVVQNVHKHIAELIPQPGRDYSISFEFPNNDANLVNIKLQGHTKSGIAFSQVIKDYLEEND